MSTPRTVRADAVVVRRLDYGEADRLITLYTAQQGKVRAIAKGVRRITSRMAGHLDLLTYSTMLLVHGRNLEIITQCQTVEGFSGLRGDLWRTTYACYCAELVDRFTEDNQPNLGLFRLLVRALHDLSTLPQESLEAAVHAFELGLLSLVGYRPELRQCLGCREPILPRPNFFSAEAGGVFCPACGAGAARAGRISVDALKLLRNLQTKPESVVGRVRQPADVLDEAKTVLDGYIHRLLERQPKAAGFIDNMARIGPANER